LLYRYNIIRMTDCLSFAMTTEFICSRPVQLQSKYWKGKDFDKKIAVNTIIF